MLLFSGESSSSQIGKRVTTILCNLTLRSQFQQYAYSLLITKREINVQVAARLPLKFLIKSSNGTLKYIRSSHIICDLVKRAMVLGNKKKNNEEMEASMN